METAKISVVVPAYGRDDCIEKCVGSLQRQDYRNLEILVVNDCSPDRTGEIVEGIAASDPRVKLLTPERDLGTHGARRAGLSAATGEYIGFADGDDFVEPAMFSTLYRKIKEADADIAICTAALVSNGERLRVDRVPIRRAETVRAGVLEKYTNLKFGSGVLWNKLYKREVILTPGLKELERGLDDSADYLVNFGAFLAARTVTLTPERLYNFVAHGSNASAKRGWSVFARILRAYVVCLELYAADHPEAAPHIDQLYLKQLHYPEYDMRTYGPPNAETLAHIAESIRRLADANPVSIYSILHALPLRYSRIHRALGAIGRR